MAHGMDVLIKNVRLIDPSVPSDEVLDVLALKGKVAATGRSIRAAPSVRVIDGSGLWLWPGLVDVHVHFREPGFTHKEDIVTGSRAAAAGGYTTVVCEPNTEPPIDSPEIVRDLVTRTQEAALVNVYFKAAMTRGRKGRQMADLRSLVRHKGVVAFSDDGDPVVSAPLMERLCREAAELDALLSPHCEDSPRALQQRKKGCDAGFEPAGPYANESAYIERDLSIARACGCRIHFSHVSMARSVDLLERARGGLGGSVSFEVTPHHLLLSGEDFAPGAVPLVNPPLRSRRDRDALQRALAGGLVDVLASDHAPHTAEDKARGACGLIGLETTLGLLLTHFVHRGRLSPLDAARLSSTVPARIFRLRAGSLRVGAPADMALIDPQKEWTVNPQAFFSKSRNTPFAGWKLKGKAVATLVGGRQVHGDEDLRERVIEPGATGD